MKICTLLCGFDRKLEPDSADNQRDAPGQLTEKAVTTDEWDAPGQLTKKAVSSDQFISREQDVAIGKPCP